MMKNIEEQMKEVNPNIEENTMNKESMTQKMMKRTSADNMYAEWMLIHSYMVHRFEKEQHMSTEDAIDLTDEWLPEPKDLEGCDYTAEG